jgi:hypothetical protein
MPGAAHAGKMDCRRVKSAAGAIFRLENAASHKRTVGTEKIDDFTRRAFFPKRARALLLQGGTRAGARAVPFVGVKTPRGGIWFS